MKRRVCKEGLEGLPPCLSMLQSSERLTHFCVEGVVGRGLIVCATPLSNTMTNEPKGYPEPQ